MVKILYLVHDLSDAAVKRRISMFIAGGAEVTVAGFRRCEDEVTEVCGCPALDFGRTYNANFKQRILSIFKTILSIGKYRDPFKDCDIVVARNLEMLAIAVRGQAAFCDKQNLIYEVLDIHRLMLKANAIGKCLRALEKWLCRDACDIWTSSPAFVHSYFDVYNITKAPIRLLENKVFDPKGALDTSPTPPPAPDPWVIGWFGAIRCRKSFDILRQLAVTMKGRVRVVIRGRVSHDQIPDFDELVQQTDHMHFEGAYQYPDDLAALYQNIHFTWAIDFFEEGLNSSWLLPNRLYEGGLFQSVPLALNSVETGRYLKKLQLGILLEDAEVPRLVNLFETMDPDQYAVLKDKARSFPSDQWACSASDCKNLVQEIGKHG